MISGKLTFEASATTATDTIEFFSSSAADALVPQAQADRFLGSETILLTAGETSATFNQTLMVSVSLGLTITATVTSNETGTLIYNTSELASIVTAFNAFIVTNTAASGPGSLAQAILNSNASDSGPNAIEFQIPQNTQQPPTEVYTIALNATTGLLPRIDRAVFINGGSETSYLDSILATPLEIPAIIEIDGPGLTGGLPGDGLVLASGSDGSTIQGLDIVNFLGAAIDIETSGNTITANTLGIDLSASSLPGNTSGILIDGSQATSRRTTSLAGPTPRSVVPPTCWATPSAPISRPVSRSQDRVPPVTPFWEISSVPILASTITVIPPVSRSPGVPRATRLVGLFSEPPTPSAIIYWQGSR